MDDVPQLRRAVFDLLTHEQDLRGALGRPGADPAVLDAIARGAVKTLVSTADAASRPLRIRVAGSDLEGGAEDAPLTVAAPSGFELFRAVLGRRSRKQVAAWNRSADPTDQLDAGFFVFGPRHDPLVEPDPGAL